MNLSVAISIPIGSWTPYLLASLSSISLQQTDNVYVAILNASDDARVNYDIKLSGIRVDYRRDGPDEGQAAAIAEGWKALQSDLVAWLNADDFFVKGSIATLINQFQTDNRTDVFYGHSTFSHEDVFVGVHPEVAPISSYIKRSNIVSQPSCFVRRSLVEAIGGIDATLDYTMDWDLWLRLYEHGANFVYSSHVYSHVTLAQNTKTASIGRKRLMECGGVLSKRQSKLGVLKGLFAIVLHNLKTYRLNSTYFVSNFHQINEPKIPFVNFHSTERSGITLKLSTPFDVQLFQVSPRGQARIQGNQLVIDFDNPIPSGDSAFLQSSDMAEISKKIISARWA